MAECHQRIKRKRRAFLHRLSAYYAREYDLVAVEDLDVKGMLESPRNSRNTAAAAWHTFEQMLEYKCEREGTHFVAVEPEGTTKECASCGVETEKLCGYANTPVPPADSPQTEMRTRRGAFFLAVYNRWEWFAPNKRLWRLRSLREPSRFLHSASWKQEVPPSPSERERASRAG